MFNRLGKAAVRVVAVLLILSVVVVAGIFAAWRFSLRPMIERDAGLANLPSDFPEIEIVRTEDATPGHIYFESYPFAFLIGQGEFRLDPWHYLMEVDTTLGELTAAKRVPIWALNFSRLNEDEFVYYKFPVEQAWGRRLGPDPAMPGSAGYYWGHFVITDTNFNTIREIKPPTDSYGMDFHEFLLLENGNIVYFDTSSAVRDLSAYDCTVDCLLLGQIIREVTPDGEIVYELDLLDYYAVEDLTNSPFLDPPPGGFTVYDLIHANSIDVTPDGDWLISVRHFDEVIKIDRETGDVVWRMGGPEAANNEFEFIDDPYNGFSHQHTAQILENGNLLLFDNGNLHDPQLSRVVEYEIDEENRTARLVWSYDDGRFTPVSGSAQRLSNGNTIISWNAVSPNIIETTPEGEIVLEIHLPESYATYRAQLFPVEQ